MDEDLTVRKWTSVRGSGKIAPASMHPCCLRTESFGSGCDDAGCMVHSAESQRRILNACI